MFSTESNVIENVDLHFTLFLEQIFFYIKKGIWLDVLFQLIFVLCVNCKNQSYTIKLVTLPLMHIESNF